MHRWTNPAGRRSRATVANNWCYFEDVTIWPWSRKYHCASCGKHRCRMWLNNCQFWDQEQSFVHVKKNSKQIKRKRKIKQQKVEHTTSAPTCCSVWFTPRRNTSSDKNIAAAVFEWMLLVLDLSPRRQESTRTVRRRASIERHSVEYVTRASVSRSPSNCCS